MNCLTMPCLALLSVESKKAVGVSRVVGHYWYYITSYDFF
jgi:hypothetical protein